MRIWTTGVIILSLAGIAEAADVGPVPSPAPGGGEFNWSGFYLGAAAGYGWLEDTDYSFVPPLHDQGDDWIAGVYAGYLHQSGAFVAGVEAGATRLDITYEGFDFITVDEAFELKARAGVAFDRILLTGHVGGSYVATNFMDLKDWGKLVGAGVEFAFTDHVTAGLSYDYMWFEEFDGTQIDADLDLVRARVGYRF